MDEKEKKDKYNLYMNDYQKKKWFCNVCNKELTISTKYKHKLSLNHLSKVWDKEDT
jgi:hypothetical protein